MPNEPEIEELVCAAGHRWDARVLREPSVGWTEWDRPYCPRCGEVGVLAEDVDVTRIENGEDA